MWNPFKNSENKSNLSIDFDLINNIYQYILNNNKEGAVSIDIKEQTGSVEACWYYFPEYFEDKDIDKLIKKEGFDNYYEILNKKYKEANINECDVKYAIENKEQYTIFEISFSTSPLPDYENSLLKSIPCYFYFMFVSTSGSNELNDFRGFFSRTIRVYQIIYFIKSKFVPDFNNPEKTDFIHFESLERNLVAISQHLKLPISSKLQKKYPESLLLGAVTENDIKRVIQLINRNLYDYDIDLLANELFADYQKNWEDLNDEVDFPTQQYFPLRYDVLLNENCWFTDWKFDPEDADEFIGDIIHPNSLDWGFEYPEDTYSHNLFPYIKTALDKMDLELMDLDCEGDSYCFLVVNKKDVAEVLNLSQKIKIGIQKVY